MISKLPILTAVLIATTVWTGCATRRVEPNEIPSIQSRGPQCVLLQQALLSQPSSQDSGVTSQLQARALSSVLSLFTPESRKIYVRLLSRSSSSEPLDVLGEKAGAGLSACAANYFPESSDLVVEGCRTGLVVALVPWTSKFTGRSKAATKEVLRSAGLSTRHSEQMTDYFDRWTLDEYRRQPQAFTRIAGGWLEECLTSR